MLLGVDVGGTFTDIVVAQADRSARAKVPSTPNDPTEGVLAAVDLVASMLGHDRSGLLRRLGRFGLGTTVVTNVLATNSGRRLGLVTTKGFEDLVPLARGSRVSDNGWLVPPPSLVDRTCIVGVAERIDRNAEVIVALDPADAVRAARRLVEREGVDALVVSFLWSFRNPAHEHAARDAVAAALPGVRVTCGSDLAPVIREFDRTQFALLNAYVDGSLDWLSTLAAELRDGGLRPPLVLTHSGGGVTTVEAARQQPIGLAQSGPAAGGAASRQLAEQRGARDLVTCDLGGTSLDVGLISDGQLLRRTRGAIVGHWTSMSMVDVDSVGSGGGSIAWIDSVGAMRVGPQSAGAVPGPACYGRGGTEPTVTDALVVLGYIDAARFLDGRMPLDEPAAHAACSRLGAALGLGAVETAWGIREIALAAMARAVRGRIAGRGLVAAELCLLAYGGCGGLFAVDIANDVGASETIVPDLAPVFSAYGAATAPLRRERARSVAARLPADAELRTTFAMLQAAALADIMADGVAEHDVVVVLEADVRFERQGAEITIPVREIDGVLEIAGLADEFRAEYARRFGAGAMAVGVDTEAMTLRAVASERARDVVLAFSAPAADAGVHVRVTRPVHLARESAPVAVPVIAFASLGRGESLLGPALIDAGDTTIWVSPGHCAHVDDAGSLVIVKDAR